MVIALILACFPHEPIEQDVESNIEQQSLWVEMYPWEIEVFQQLEGLLEPCLPSEEPMPHHILRWSGECRYDDIKLTGSIEIHNDRFYAQHFSIQNIQTNELIFHLNGSADWSEQNDLLRIESNIQTCRGLNDCQEPSQLRVLVKTIYPFSTFPKQYETKITGLRIAEETIRIDATLEFDKERCETEPINGFIGMGEYELQMDGEHFCDGCGGSFHQGHKQQEICTVFYQHLVQ